MKSNEFLGEDSEPCVAVVPLQRTWRQERRGPIPRPPPPLRRDRRLNYFIAYLRVRIKPRSSLEF